MVNPVCKRASSRVGVALTAAVAVCLIGPMAAADTIIDDFAAVSTPNPWPQTQSVPGFDDVFETGVGAGINGIRQTRIVAALLADGSDSITVGIDTAAPGMNSDGVISYESTGGAQGALALIYDGAGLNLDLSADNGLFIDFESATWGDDPIRTTLTLFDDDGLMATGRDDLINQGAQTQFISFASLDFIDLVDLSEIERIEVSFDAQDQGTDFSVSLIYTAVPAPGAIALLGMAGMCGHRRRRRA